MPNTTTAAMVMVLCLCTQAKQRPGRRSAYGSEACLVGLQSYGSAPGKAEIEPRRWSLRWLGELLVGAVREEIVDRWRWLQVAGFGMDVEQHF